MFSEIQMLSRLYDVTIDLTTIFGLPSKGALIDMQSISNRQRRPCALRGDFPVGATSSRPFHGGLLFAKATQNKRLAPKLRKVASPQGGNKDGYIPPISKNYQP